MSVLNSNLEIEKGLFLVIKSKRVEFLSQLDQLQKQVWDYWHVKNLELEPVPLYEYATNDIADILNIDESLVIYLLQVLDARGLLERELPRYVIRFKGKVNLEVKEGELEWIEKNLES